MLVFNKSFFESIESSFDSFEDYRDGYGSQVDEISKLSFENLSANFFDELASYLSSESYSKFRDTALILIDSATYKEHLHKSFEWFACIQLSKKYNSKFIRWEDVSPNLREEKNNSFN